MAQLSEGTVAALRPRLPAHASLENPVDMLPSADAAIYGFALKKILEDPGVDMAIVICVPPVRMDPVEVIGAIEEARRGAGKPVVGVLMAPKEAAALLRESYPQHLAICQFPEAAAGALAALERQRRWRARGHGREPKFPVKRAVAEQIFKSARSEGRTELHLHECFEVLSAYGIPVARYALVNSAAAAEDAARSLGWPVAMKRSAAGINHKTESRAVALNIGTTDQAFHTYHGLTHDGTDAGTVVVQVMVTGRETILGMVRDASLGPLLVFGLGGLFVETLRDVNFRPVPMTDLDARELIRGIRGYPVLSGVRGQRPVAFDVLEEAVLRLSQLVADFACLEEMDINPFLASEFPADCRAVDCRIRLSAVDAPRA
jgi:acetyltransferase